jgi:uncharacterized repeat protein (TIGR01451 family)
MRRFSGLSRLALRTTIIGSLTVLAGIVFLPCGVAAADTVTTDFEAPTFHACAAPQPVFAACGTVDGQDGWKSAVPGNIPSLPQGYDQQVVVNSSFGPPASFGGQSLRLSNGYNQFNAGPAEFFYQTYAGPTTDPAGENEANQEYTAQFSFISTSPQAQQDGLFVSVSPDNGSGGRMSYIGLDDTASGIAVNFYDTNAQGEFVAYDLGVFPRDVPHTVRFWMKLNPGPDNDFVRIAIDGQDTGQCYTTWENFYRSVSQSVPVTDTLQFRSASDWPGGVNPALLNGGYLFDNVSITTGGPGPPTCDLPIEKQANKRTVHPGGLVRYRLTVRNRGRLAERNLLVCDHIPRQAIFVSASRKLRHLGPRRCLLISRLRSGQRASFHIVLRVKPNAAPGVMDNTGDETPVQPPDVPPPVTMPPGSTTPDVPGSGAGTPPPVGQDSAPVRIVRPRIPPRFTG